MNNSFKLKIEYLSIHIDIVENYANDNSHSINHIVYTMKGKCFTARFDYSFIFTPRRQIRGLHNN